MKDIDAVLDDGLLDDRLPDAGTPDADAAGRLQLHAGVSLPAVLAALVCSGLFAVAIQGHDRLRAGFWLLLAAAWALSALPWLRQQRPLRLLGVGCALLALVLLAIQFSGSAPAMAPA